jgi:hypothetical protein
MGYFEGIKIFWHVKDELNELIHQWVNKHDTLFF